MADDRAVVDSSDPVRACRPARQVQWNRTNIGARVRSRRRGLVEESRLGRERVLDEKWQGPRSSKWRTRPAAIVLYTERQRPFGRRAVSCLATARPVLQRTRTRRGLCEKQPVRARATSVNDVNPPPLRADVTRKRRGAIRISRRWLGRRSSFYPGPFPRSAGSLPPPRRHSVCRRKVKPGRAGFCFPLFFCCVPNIWNGHASRSARTRIEQRGISETEGACSSGARPFARGAMIVAFAKHGLTIARGWALDRETSPGFKRRRAGPRAFPHDPAGDPSTRRRAR